MGSIVGSGGPIPLAIWSPLAQDATHLILAGHGGSTNKLEPYIASLATGLVRRHGCCVIAIDGPVHGDRAPSGVEPSLVGLEFARAWSSDAHLTDSMVRDWRETIDAAFSEGLVPAAATVGYWGLSMGTIFGLPLVAAEPRITAAVLGLMGVTGPTQERIRTDAAAVRVPTMFLTQWDDELVKLDEALALFGAIAATDKTLIVTPGKHVEVTAENFRRSSYFLADRLGAET